jgi:hypothetical protein
VTRLSIIVPALGTIEQLETTLVAILSQRPPRSEVVVVLGAPYADPYQLEGEVRFVQAPTARWADCANLGVAASAAPIVNIVTAGAEVCEAWSAAALRHFEDPGVASVAPLLLDRADQTRVLAAGVEYRRGGRRVASSAGSSTDHMEDAARPIGPTWMAGFYRKSTFMAVGGFDPSVGDRFSDVDLALRLRYAGFRCVSEWYSRVVADSSFVAVQPTVADAFYNERVFWRNVSYDLSLAAMTAHLGMLASEFVTNLARFSAPALLLARLFAALDLGAYARHRQRCRSLRAKLADSLGAHSQGPRILRIDPAHPAAAARHPSSRAPRLAA